MLIGDVSTEYRYVDRALTALTNFNLAAGFSLAGEEPLDRPEIRRSYARLAVSSVRALDAQNRWDEKRAQRDAEHLGRQLPGAVPASTNGMALVYLMTHDGYGAAKVGISDKAGRRLAQHRLQGWQTMAAFLTSARTAAAAERDILRWWRGLGLPSYLTPGQMPQGGWTETVAAARIDLAATVTRICNLAVASPLPTAPALTGRSSSKRI